VNNTLVRQAVKQLKKERARMKTQLHGLEAALTALPSLISGDGTRPYHKRRKMSAKSRALIAAAQKRRWLRWRKKHKKAA
jgi:hypothetical protein